MAPAERLHLRTYNVTGFSCTPTSLAEHIRHYVPNFRVHYEPCQMRQRIADSWPQSLDDSTARLDWAWSPEYTIERTVHEMLQRLGHPMAANAEDIVDGRQQNEGEEEGDEGQQKQLAMA
jgi:nucleoside-diphosphate-sugar epimerase